MMNEIKFLTVQDVIVFNYQQVRLFGGTHGIRDMGLLESAVYAAQSGHGEKYFHESLTQMASAYIFHIIKNHPFIDGNKRTGMISGMLFLQRNEIDVRWSQDEIFEIGVKVASSELRKEELVALIDKITFTN